MNPELIQIFQECLELSRCLERLERDERDSIRRGLKGQLQSVYLTAIDAVEQETETLRNQISYLLRDELQSM